MSKRASFVLVVLCVLNACPARPARAARAVGDPSPAYLQDRGPGVATSMFGTYVRRGELLVYPFFEHYRDRNMEYKPVEFGYGLDRDFRGRFRASEGILFVGYGITDRIAVEIEGAIIQASLTKAADDPSATPATIREAGTGDVEGQIRWRWMDERQNRPEVFSYVEAVSPQQRTKVLIGTPDWEFKLGAGMVKGHRWGTTTLRASAVYLRENGSLDVGEFAVEYLKRLSPRWRAYAGIEGAQDEASFITEGQWHLSDRMFLKLNNGFGITSKATDWTPEIGWVFTFPVSRNSLSALTSPRDPSGHGGSRGAPGGRGWPFG